ncbi:MAG TPA: transporter [Verrucomicrobiae bacterium]|nr:transporter [Verrucomicrobiae bacterium]
MKINLSRLGLTALGLATSLALAISTPAQGSSDKSQPLSIAPTTADDSSKADDEAAREAELVKQTLNPVASLISVPIQNNWDFGIGPAHAFKYTANVQPVIPISLSDDWNLISRTIVPVIYAQSPVKGGEDHAGLGDITQSFFFSPKQPVGGWIMGAGPVFLLPGATQEALGSGKWGAGPTAVLLQQKNGFTYGILANQIWSFAGQEDRATVNAAFVQPFLSYSTKTYTSFGVNTESTRNWETDQWSVPMNFTITQLLKIKGQPISIQLGYRYYVDGPDGGPKWGLRFAVTLLFPKNVEAEKSL